MTEKLKPCPFCGGSGKISFKNYKFIGRGIHGQKKLKYRVQIICNKCRSRGKPVITDEMINPNPYISKWGNLDYESSPIGTKQTEMFKLYVEEAIKAWNRRAE